MWLHFFGLSLMVGSSGALRGERLQRSNNEQPELEATRYFPGNYACKFRDTDTVENLKDYVSFFEAGFGKSVRIGGDSLAMQLYHAIVCAVKFFSYHWEEHAGILSVKPSADAPRNRTLYMNFDGFFFHIEELTGYEPHFSKTLDMLMHPHYDFYIANVGHYIYENSTTFAKYAETLFAEMRKRADETGTHVVWMDHPPQHFNTDKGNYRDDQGFATEGHDCSCAQKHLEQQDTRVNNDLAAPLARRYGFDYVALWDDMNLCDEHPFDCTHFTLSPTLFRSPIRSIAKIFAR